MEINLCSACINRFFVNQLTSRTRRRRTLFYMTIQRGRWKCETWKNGKGNNGTKISQKCRGGNSEKRTGTMLLGVQMRDTNIRERQTMESRWLLNTCKHGQCCLQHCRQVLIALGYDWTTESESVINRVGPLLAILADRIIPLHFWISVRSQMSATVVLRWMAEESHCRTIATVGAR